MKRIILASILAIVIFVASCKKEKESDNPNINHRTVNLEMKVSSYNGDSEMLFDINEDGMLDFGLYLELYKDSIDDYDYELYLYGEDSGYEILTSKINLNDYIKPLNINDLINSGSPTWYNDSYIFEVEKSPSYPEEKYGFSGKDDMLIGIRFLIGTELHYGWLKLDVAADYKSVTVNEVAYDSRPNIEIRAGEK